VIRVRIPDVSVELYFTSNAQLADAMRQLWIVLGDVDGTLPLSAQDAADTEEILRRYRPQGHAVAAHAAAADARGDLTFTVEIDLPADALEHLDHLLGLFDRIDRMNAQQGLALPASPEIRHFRRALITSMADQLRGRGPDGTRTLESDATPVTGGDRR
jgi:hypothetical protein